LTIKIFIRGEEEEDEGGNRCLFVGVGVGVVASNDGTIKMLEISI
jgi:hypothetical protein